MCSSSDAASLWPNAARLTIQRNPLTVRTNDVSIFVRRFTLWCANVVVHGEQACARARAYECNYIIDFAMNERDIDEQIAEHVISCKSRCSFVLASFDSHADRSRLHKRDQRNANSSVGFTGHLIYDSNARISVCRSGRPPSV